MLSSHFLVKREPYARELCGLLHAWRTGNRELQDFNSGFSIQSSFGFGHRTEALHTLLFVYLSKGRDGNSVITPLPF